MHNQAGCPETLKTPLTVRGVWKKFNGKYVLKNINIELREKEFYGLLGPNGAGKTTLLRIIVGVFKPTKGTVVINGVDILEDSIKAKKHIGYVPQENILSPHLTGMENLLYYAGLQGLPRSTARKRARELLEFFGLTEYANVRVSKYSGGMMKKLSIAAGLIHDPPLLILDEPTTGLDPASRRDLWDLLLRLNREGKTIIMATHYTEEADKLCHRVAVMNEGEIVVEGPPQELKKRYGPPSIIELHVSNGASKIVGVISGYANGKVVRVDDKVLLPVDDYREVLPKVIEKIVEIGVDIRRIEIREPTLDDVFIKLTGRRLE